MTRLFVVAVFLCLLLAGASCGKSEPGTTPTSDTTSPSITNVLALDITETTATISWTTDEPATSQVEYGKTTSCWSRTPLNKELVTSHSVTLAGLETGTTYYFRAKSKDAGGNEVSYGYKTFFTASPPGLGAATGQVLFPDGMPAYRSIVYIFKQGETSSFASCWVDVDGYYSFPKLPVGSYELYAASYATIWGFTDPPDAEITVSEQEVVIVPTITVLRNIVISCQEEFTTTTQPEFSWEAVPNAKYYSVKVRSITDGYGDYTKEMQILDTQVTWSALSPGHYRVDVNAHNEQDSLIGSGCEWFWIGHRPAST